MPRQIWVRSAESCPGSSRLDDGRWNGVGLPGHLFNQHVGNLDGPRQSGTDWRLGANDAWFCGRFDLRLDLRVQHAMGRCSLGIDLGVGDRLGMRLTPCLLVAQKSKSTLLITLSFHLNGLQPNLALDKLVNRNQKPHLLWFGQSF